MGELHSQNIFIILCCLRSVKGIFVLLIELRFTGRVNCSKKIGHHECDAPIGQIKRSLKVKLKKLLDDVWFQNLHNSIKILFFMNV